MPKLLLRVLDQNDQPIDALVQLSGAHQERSVPVPGSWTIELSPGRYQVTIRRGPEWTHFDTDLDLSTDQTHTVRLSRVIDLTAEGWHAGNLWGPPSPERMLEWMRALELSVAAQPVPAADRRGGFRRFQVDPDHVYTLGDWSWTFPEIGTLRLLCPPKPLPEPLPDDPIGIVEVAGAAGAHLDAPGPLRPFHAAVAALDRLDSFGILADPRTAAVADYYRLLNCGVRLPVSAGTPEGTTYVYLGDEPLTLDGWYSALRQGRSFATLGPLLLLRANGEEPGALLRAPWGEPFRLQIELTLLSTTPLDRVELIHNGWPVTSWSTPTPTSGRPRRWEETLELERSGWLIARALEGDRVLAHTSPIYAFLGTDQVAHQEDAKYWLDQLRSPAGRSLGELGQMARDYFTLNAELAAAQERGEEL